MVEQAHVKLSGDINGRYVVTDQRAGGELTLVPDTSWEAILERSGGREMRPEESAEFWREHSLTCFRPTTNRRPLSRAGRRCFPAYFDQTAWEEDLARSTPTGRQAAEVARRGYERGGVPIEHLRRVHELGDDRTVLPDCA